MNMHTWIDHRAKVSPEKPAAILVPLNWRLALPELLLVEMFLQKPF